MPPEPYPLPPLPVSAPAPGSGTRWPRTSRSSSCSGGRTGSSGQYSSGRASSCPRARPFISSAALPPVPLMERLWRGGLWVWGCCRLQPSTPPPAPQDVLRRLPGQLHAAGDLQPDARRPFWGLQELLAHHVLRGHLAARQHCGGLQEPPRCVRALRVRHARRQGQQIPPGPAEGLGSPSTPGQGRAMPNCFLHRHILEQSPV